MSIASCLLLSRKLFWIVRATDNVESVNCSERVVKGYANYGSYVLSISLAVHRCQHK